MSASVCERECVCVPWDLVTSKQQQGREDIQVEFNQVLTRQSQKHQAQDVTCEVVTHAVSKKWQYMHYKSISVASCLQTTLRFQSQKWYTWCACVTDVPYVIAGSYFWQSIKQSLLPIGLSYSGTLPKTIQKTPQCIATVTLVLQSLSLFYSVCPPTALISTYQAYSLIDQLQPSLTAHTHKHRHIKNTHRKLSLIWASCFLLASSNHRQAIRLCCVNFTLTSLLLSFSASVSLEIHLTGSLCSRDIL